MPRLEATRNEAVYLVVEQASVVSLSNEVVLDSDFMTLAVRCFELACEGSGLNMLLAKLEYNWTR